MVALAGDAFIDVDADFDYEDTARGLLNAPTPIHRLGRMIGAIAVLDVYFPGNPKNRLGPLLEGYEVLCARHDDASLRAVRDRYVERLSAIESSRAEWLNLRANELTVSALNAALTCDDGKGATPAASHAQTGPNKQETGKLKHGGLS
jgi:hypothetical protein